MKHMLLFLSFFYITTNTYAQNNTEFDFWVGTWDAYWSDSLKGTNTLTKTLDNKVIEENFVAHDKSLIGKSWTLYDANAKIWRQTWVDNSGAYLLFTGGKEGDNVVLNMVDVRKNKEGKNVYMRMVFYNITENSFSWDWESSTDEKKTWQNQWAIQYKRRETR
jgi:hypothetical protein